MYDDTTRPARAMVAAARVGGGAERHRHVAAVHKAGVVPGAAELTAGLAERAGSRGEAGSGEDAGGPSRMPVVWRKAWGCCQVSESTAGPNAGLTQTCPSSDNCS